MVLEDLLDYSKNFLDSENFSTALENSFGGENFFFRAEPFLRVLKGLGEWELENFSWKLKEFSGELRNFCVQLMNFFMERKNFSAVLEKFFGTLKNFSTNEGFLGMLKNYLGGEGFFFKAE